MKLYLHVALACGLATILLVPLVKRLAVALGAVDYPAERRKIHQGAVPRLGGVAVFLPVIVLMALGPWLVPEGMARLGDFEFFALLVGAIAIFVLGFVDDINGANATTKFAVQACVATFAYYAGLQISRASMPLGWSVNLGPLALPVTILWLIGMMNGINLLDGVDGLAAGVTAIAALSLVVVSSITGRFEVAVIAAGLLGSLLGFLLFNFNPASIFLGDAGALSIGFLLAALSIAGSQKGAAAVALLVPIIALGIPIIDTSLAFLRRILHGKHPFQGDREHVHHRLLAMGLSQRQVALTLYAVSGVLAVIAMLLPTAGRVEAFLALLCLAGVLALGFRRLGAGEIAELLGLFRHGERRRRPPRYRALLVRNTLPLLQQCETLEQLRVLIEEIREILGLSTLRIRFADGILGVPPNADSEIVLASPEKCWNGNGRSEWVCTLDVYCEMQGGRGPRKGDCKARESCRIRSGDCRMGRGRVVAALSATKPAWKRRRKSEHDEEILTLLADGLGRWVGRNLSAKVLARPRILIADDDPIFRMGIERALRDNYELFHAEDGKEAIAKAREVLPDLVLLDLKMPNVDGYGVVQALRADLRTQRMPVIMVTGMDDVTDRIRGIGMGADDYIIKPCHIEELKARVRMVLRRAYA